MKIRNCVKVGAIMLVMFATSCTQTNGNENNFDKNKNITLYSRAAGSGTRECFFEGIGYKDVAKEDKWNSGVTVSTKASNSEIMSAVGNDEYAVGYCSLDSVSAVSTIKALKYEGIEATKTNVLNGSYQLKRNFNYVIRDYSLEEDLYKKQAVLGFIDFLTNTMEGQSTISSNGGIVETRTDLVAFNDIKNNYPIFNTSQEITIDFCGSTSVEKIILSAVNKIKTLITNTKLNYILNQTGSGDAVVGVTDGKNGKEYGIGFLSREISESESGKLSINNTNGSFAIDAVVPIVNINNKDYKETTAEQLTSMYKGEKKLWSDFIA